MKIYYQISKFIDLEKSNAIIKISGRKKRIQIPVWASRLNDFMKEIIKMERDELVAYIINQNYIIGKNDKVILNRVPITESSYYRLKRRIEQKIYELYIKEGYVTKEEIFNNKIFQ